MADNLAEKMKKLLAKMDAEIKENKQQGDPGALGKEIEAEAKKAAAEAKKAPERRSRINRRRSNGKEQFAMGAKTTKFIQEIQDACDEFAPLGVQLTKNFEELSICQGTNRSPVGIV